MLKRTIIFVALLLALAGIGFGQENRMHVKTMQGIIAKADWVLVTTDVNENPVYVDRTDMVRIASVVMFYSKFIKRDTIVYTTVAGNCTTDNFIQTNGFSVYPDSPRLYEVSLETDNILLKARPDSIGAALLDYTCKNAKVLALPDENNS